MIALVDRLVAFTVDPVMVEFAVKVLTLIAFPTMVENWIMLVDRRMVLMVDAVSVEFITAF